MKKRTTGVTSNLTGINLQISNIIGQSGNREGQVIVNQPDETNKVLQFIKNICLDSRDQSTIRENNRRDDSPQPGTSKETTRQADKGDHQLADQLILEAEHFKTAIAAPQGENVVNNTFVDDLNAKSPSVASVHDNVLTGMSEFLQMLAANRADDEFFHITCHINPALKGKIERGEYVDLDKLLPKSRLQLMADDDIEVVRCNGDTYTFPMHKESKITNIRKWEQAFRVYAAIYSNANPRYSAEIWQYVYMINTAAMSYAWENVLYYDFTFRQLMHANPNHSWAKTYTQIWNLAMCDPLTKNHQTGNGYSNHSDFQSNSTSAKKGDWRDNCCWGYNKLGRCRRSNCRFDHRCSYCGAYSHTKVNCSKKKCLEVNQDNNARVKVENRESPGHTKWK